MITIMWRNAGITIKFFSFFFSFPPPSPRAFWSLILIPYTYKAYTYKALCRCLVCICRENYLFFIKELSLSLSGMMYNHQQTFRLLLV